MERTTICFFMLVWLVTASAYGMDAVGYFNLGLESSMTRKKINCFTKALELNPKIAAAYEKRGMLYYFQEKYDKAIHDYHKYIELAPAKAEAYRMLGLSYLKSGSYEAAIYNFNRAVVMEPEQAHTYANRADAFRLCGKYEEAIQDSTRAIKLGGNPITKSNAYRTRAKVYRKIGRDELAMADDEAAWQVDPRINLWYRYFLRYASPKDLSGMGLIIIIGIAFVLIFGLKFNSPKKEE